MKIECWFIGKTNTSYFQEGVQVYEKRLKRYLPIQVDIVPDIKQAGKLSANQLKEEEGERILSRLKPNDYLVLLDEKGGHFGSVAFAKHLQKRLNQHHNRLIFLVGGAYGFSQKIYDRSNEKLSLSQMTFSHQMIRVFLLEQIYRAMTILRNEPYHNE